MTLVIVRTIGSKVLRAISIKNFLVSVLATYMVSGSILSPLSASSF